MDVRRMGNLRCPQPEVFSSSEGPAASRFLRFSTSPLRLSLALLLFQAYDIVHTSTANETPRLRALPNDGVISMTEQLSV